MAPGILASRLLSGFPHGFTTRLGGTSEGPFESLNLSATVGDDPDRVRANWAILQDATGLQFARVRQVHGCRVVEGSAPGDPVEEADAVTSSRPGVAACVSVADCVPILLADPRSGAVAAVHAGWRGTIGGAAVAGVRALVDRYGASPTEVLAVLGPAIGPCCFEVSTELAARFHDEVGPTAANPRSRGSRIDLWRANELLLRRAGLMRRHVELLARCTSCEEGLFFSHRRDEGRSGRQVGFVAPVA